MQQDKQISEGIKKTLISDYQRLLDALAQKYNPEELEIFLSEQAEAIQQNAIIQERKWLKHLRAPEYIKTCRIPSKFPQQTHVFQLHKSFNISGETNQFYIYWDPTCVVQDILMYIKRANLEPIFNSLGGGDVKNGVTFNQTFTIKAGNDHLNAEGFSYIGNNNIPMKDFQSIRLTGAALKITYFGRQDAAKGLLYYGQMPYQKNASKHIAQRQTFHCITNQLMHPRNDQQANEQMVVQEAENNLAQNIPGVADDFAIENSFLLSCQGIENLFNATIRKATSGMRIIWLPLSEDSLKYNTTLGSLEQGIPSFMHYICGQGLASGESNIIHVDMFSSYEAIPIPSKREIYNPRSAAPGDFNHQAQMISQLQPVT